MGGSFDPMHLSHQAMVEHVLAIPEVKELWLIPVGVAVHRQLSGRASAMTRLKWVETIYAAESRVQVLDWEVMNDHPTPTLETLVRLHQYQPGIVPMLVLGADAFHGLAQWYGYPKHQELCNLCVFPRKGINFCEMHNWQGATENWQNSTGHVLHMSVVLPDISSTYIRHQVQQGLSLDGLVDQCLIHEIEDSYGGLKQMEANKMLEQVITALEDKKAIVIESLDVQGRCSETDYFVIATGKTDRHLKAMANAASEVAHQNNMPFICEGREAAEWLLVDLDTVIVHLFLPHIRTEVSLEKLWIKTDEVKASATVETVTD